MACSIDQRSEETTMFERKPSAKPPVKTVLVVEDDQDIGEVFVQVLSQETSYLPVLATDGEEALAFMQEIHPDLVGSGQQGNDVVE